MILRFAPHPAARSIPTSGRRGMSEMKWELLDDNVFVYLVADLLQQLEFTAIQYQGDGPDGGLDLFATQLVALGIQTPQPFRWGIQCKFSVTAKRRSVGDAEIKDVEGILRSERYLAQELRGYMLVTNRRITQNVIERLRGIDARSSFRASTIDGTQLELVLAKHPSLVERYFNRVQATVRHLGSPTLVAQFDHTVSPSVPTVEVHLRSAYSGANSKGVSARAILDPGAAVTMIPIYAVHALQLREYDSVSVQGVLGGHQVAPVYAVTIELGGTEIGPVGMIALGAIDYVLIGWDVMKELIVLWDGPNESLQVWAEEANSEQDVGAETQQSGATENPAAA